MASPTRDAIQHVMGACSVSETQAIELLKRSNNDAERAKHRHQTLSRFLKPSAKSPSRSPASSKAPSINNIPLKNKPSIESRPIVLSDESSEDERLVFTPRTEEEPPPPRLPPPVPSRPAKPRKLSREPQYEPYRPPVPPSSHSAPPDLPQQNQPGPNGESTSSLPSQEQNDTDRMDYQMDHQPALPSLIVPSPRPVSSLSHKSSSRSSLQQEPIVEAAAPENRNIPTIQETPPPVNEDPVEEPAPFDEPDFDFLLPWLPRPTSLIPGRIGNSTAFNAYDISAAIQHGADEHAVQTYFQQFDPNAIARHIGENVSGYPSIFYAVATNNDYILRLWIRHGADVNAVHPATGAPLLAFAILHSETIESDTSAIVATLLSLNASPLSIPGPIYTPYFRNLPDDVLSDEALKSLGRQTEQWLTKDIRAKLIRATHLTHRYNLERASKTPRPSARHWQIAHRKNAEALLGLPYFLIGQSMASNHLLHKFLSHLAVPSRKPLVLVFAGPSGHGKTELARRLGYLMNLELEVVDCTIVSREMELFGGRHPYVNADQGTPLNNFLARNHGQRSIVFLDEFEKTTKEIHQALLLPFDNGEYQDRRNLKKIDCSQTIWILATNALDKKIKNFCQVNGEELFNDEDQAKQAKLLKGLSKELKEDFLSKFDAPVTGRVSAFLPFLLFSPGEQAVIAHKYLLELGRDVRSPVNLAVGADERLIGNVRLKVRRDASVCKNIADDGYHPELGARSLISAVDSVKTLLVDAYLGVDAAITESATLVDFVVDVNGGEIVTAMAHSTV